MKKLIYILFATSFLFLTGCGENNLENQDLTPITETTQETTQETIQVVATFSILADMVSQVGGDLVEIYTIVPIGEDPHEHEALPFDLIAVSNADVIFYNGLNLETAGRWLYDVFDATDREENVHFFRASYGITPLNLTVPGLERYYDPHAWLDIRNGIIYLQNIARILGQISPENATVFNQNANVEIERLTALHNEFASAFNALPNDFNLVITAEGAFRYFALAYGVNTAYIWQVNAHDEGTPEQMIRIIDIVNNSSVPYLFIESSVEHYYIEQVSEETGVPIFGMLFTDSLDEPGEPASTYYGMMRHNLEMISAAFGL